MQLSNNSIVLGPHSITKTHYKKNPYFKSLTREIINIFFEQPIEYQQAYKRALFESECLLVWNKHNLLAPKLIKLRHQTIEMSRVDGINISSLTNHTELLEIIPKIYDNLIQRHSLSTIHNQKLLIHIDSNLNNILIDKNNDIIHLDFEMGRFNEPIVLWKSRELSKLLTSLINHVGEKMFIKTINYLLSDKPTKTIINNLILANNNKIRKNKLVTRTNSKYSFIDTLCIINNTIKA